MLVDNIQLNPGEITIKGSATLLNTISKIMIPAEAIDVTGAQDIHNTTVNITSYLPDGVGLADSSQAQIDVTVNLSEAIEKTYAIPVANIEIRNLPEGYTVDFEGLRAEVSIYATASSHESLAAADITGYIDLAEATEETTEALIHLDLNDRYDVVPSYVAITISSGDTGETGEENDN